MAIVTPTSETTAAAAAKTLRNRRSRVCPVNICSRGRRARVIPLPIGTSVMWLNPHRSGYIQRANGRFGIPQTEVCEQARWDDMAGVAATTSTPARIAIRPQSTAETSAAAGFRRYLLLGLCGLFAFYLAWLVVEPGSGSARWLYNLLLVGSAFVCLKSPRLRGEERTAWLCLGATLILWAAGDFYYTLFLARRRGSAAHRDRRLWLVSYPFLYAAIALLVRARARASTGACGSTPSSPRSPSRRSAPPSSSAAWSSAPAARPDRRHESRLPARRRAPARARRRRARAERLANRPPGLLILAGTAVLALADSATLYQAIGGISDGMPILDAGWPLAMLLLAAAAWQPARPLGAVRLEGIRLLAVPAVFGLTSLAILVYGQFEPLNTPAVVLAATSMLAVIARMAFTFREKLELLAATRVEARTDALTGVGNRRKLMTTWARACRPARPVLMLLDLDGFKAYNDTFGHPAGDALLARLARKLATSIAGEGEVYRIGGDEFCVLAPWRRRVARSSRWLRGGAIQEHGEGFRITAAQGSVALPGRRPTSRRRSGSSTSECTTRKTGGGPPPDARAGTCCCGSSTSGTIACKGTWPSSSSSCRQPAGELGFSPDELGDLRLAAELHEVGKLAIPTRSC